MAPGMKGGRRFAKNRQTKIHLVFNEDDRKEFLSGFKKRKDARRQKAREEMELKVKEERRRIKQDQREALKAMFYTHRSIPEVEHLVEPVTYELQDHTVTVSSIADVDFQGRNDLLLGQNKSKSDSEEDEEEARTPQTSQTLTSLNKELKKQRIKKIKSSKAFEMKQKLKQKRDRQQARRKRNILKKRDKHKGKRFQ